MKKYMVAVVSLGLLAGCATTLEGQTQPITVNVIGAKYAECYLYNKDIRYLVRAGETRNITKSSNDLTVECLAEGNRMAKVIVDSQLEPMVLANVTNGVVPGTTYDHFSKGMYAYPEVITVDFTNIPPQAFAMPEYMDPSVRSTYVGEEEYMGPPTRVISSSPKRVSPIMRKNSNGEIGNPLDQFAPPEPKPDMAGMAPKPPAVLIPVTEK